MFIEIIVLVLLNFVPTYSTNEKLRGHSVIYGISTLAKDLKNSSTCHEQLNDLYEAIETEKIWGLKVMDASGEPSSGFLYGNNFWMGSHTQCIDIEKKNKMQVNHNKVERPAPTPFDYPPYELGFSMAYMTHNNTLQLHAQLPLEFTIQLGLCIPASCRNEQIMNLLRKYIDGRYLEFQNIYHLDLNLYDVKNLNNGLWILALPKTIVFLSIAIILTMLLIAGTIYDVKKHNLEKNIILGHNGNIAKQHTTNNVSTVELVTNSNESISNSSSTIGEILKCFSIYSNTKSILNTSLPSDSIACIHGIRTLGMFWVIVVHTIFFIVDYLDNKGEAYKLGDNFIEQIITNSTYCVDTFLFLSGFLIGYLFFKSKKNCEEDKPINYSVKISEFFNMVLNRFLRLTPPYLAMLMLANVMYTYYSKSSALLSGEKVEDLCDQYWWRNVLYINNLYPRKEMCLSWSWYLSLDMQIFVIVAILLILSTIKFKISAVIVFILTIVNVISVTYKAYSIQYIPTMDEQLRQLDEIYDLTWQRWGAYFVGVITAYILIVKLERKLPLTKKTRIILWCLFPLINLWILFTLYTRNLSVEFSAVYMGISRTLWGVGLGWLIIACCTGNAKILDKFLSFRGFIPLSRLTYCAYLLNPLVANMMYLGSGTQFKASLAGFALIAMGITFTTIVLAFVLSLYVESPFILLTKVAMNKMKEQSKGSVKPKFTP